ncbi:MAG: hypothetical protein IJY12_00830 [Clostridia bacterium]|nr:hypothetical protein [Clostridia bacterium]
MVTKEQIKNSMDAKWRLGQIKTYSVILGGILVSLLCFALFSGILHGDLALAFEVTGIYALLFIIIFAPFPLYNLYRYRKLFHHPEEYHLYTAVLDRPNTSYFYRGAIYYTVTLHTPDGFTRQANTKPLFSGGALASFPLDKYNNQTVTVAYKENENLLVILDEQKG